MTWDDGGIMRAVTRSVAAIGGLALVVGFASTAGATATESRGASAEAPGQAVRAIAVDGLVRGRELAAQLVADAGDGGAAGIGSAAFAERHAMLAEKHAERPGNAAAVHAALAAGDSPSSAAPGRSGSLPPGQARKAERLAAAEAAAALRGDDRPGLGLGRGRGGGDD